MSVRIFGLTVLSFLYSFLSISAEIKSQEIDFAKTQSSIEECQRIVEWGLVPDQEDLNVRCSEDFQHYVPKEIKYDAIGQVRIGNFNLLHPGTDKTLFKDYDLIAEIIHSQFDVMAGIELVDVVGNDFYKNQRLLKFLNEKFKKFQQPQQAIIQSNSQGQVSSNESLVESNENAKKEFKELASYYRIPGYLMILEKLRKKNPHWALVISPHGDAADEVNLQERVGFFYRTDRLSLTNNIHCQSRFGKKTEACYPNLDADYMGENVSPLFSRRPFMATFKNEDKDFTLLASHVIFEPPRNEELKKQMLKTTFNVETLDLLPMGINHKNFARFVEVALTLRFIQNLRNEGIQRIIFAGDFNLEASNKFWPVILKEHPTMKLLVEAKTSVTPFRFQKGTETNGASSNYDHFMMSESDLSSCDKPEALNIATGDLSNPLKAKYLVRKDAPIGPYVLRDNSPKKIENSTRKLLSQLAKFNFKLSRQGIIAPDEVANLNDLNNFRERVFNSQLSDLTYYKFVVQTMSDHFPIRIKCSF